MANGRLAGVECTSTGDNLIYTAPSGVASTVVVTVSSRTGVEVATQLFVTTGGTPVDADCISPTFAIKDEPKTYTGLVLDAGQKLYANVDIADVIVVSVNGLEGVI